LCAFFFQDEKTHNLIKYIFRLNQTRSVRVSFKKKIKMDADQSVNDKDIKPPPKPLKPALVNQDEVVYNDLIIMNSDVNSDVTIHDQSTKNDDKLPVKPPPKPLKPAVVNQDEVAYNDLIIMGSNVKVSDQSSKNGDKFPIKLPPKQLKCTLMDQDEKDLIILDSDVKAQEVSIIEPPTTGIAFSAKLMHAKDLYKFLCGNIRGKTRQQLSLFIGADPNSFGKTCGCCMASVHYISTHIDSCLQLFFIPPFLDGSTKFCCTRQALIGGFVENILLKNIHIEKFPQGFDELDILIQLYYRDLYGFKRVEYKTRVKYSSIEREILITSIRKKNDMLFGQNLVRLLKIGSSQGRITTSELYKFCHREYQCFRCCYGGSRSLALSTVNYLEKKNVPYETVVDTIKNFNALWAEYINDLLDEIIESSSSFGHNGNILLGSV
jgi:hypothetical protein